MSKRSNPCREYVSAIWKHPCGHTCEWITPTTKKNLENVGMSRVQYAEFITMSFARFNCPWCGAATGTFFAPQGEEEIGFDNYIVPIYVRKVSMITEQGE